MKITQQLAKHFRQVYFGGNRTASNLKGQLDNISLEMAIKPVNELNTILALTFHIHYYSYSLLP